MIEKTVWAELEVEPFPLIVAAVVLERELSGNFDSCTRAVSFHCPKEVTSSVVAVVVVVDADVAVVDFFRRLKRVLKIELVQPCVVVVVVAAAASSCWLFD